MKNIGLLLKEAREEKGLSLDEAAKLTKITKGRLAALENGNIEYFNNDISYVKYYVNLYAKVLGIEYDTIKDNLKDSLIEFDEMTRTSVILERKLMERSINEKTKDLSDKKVKKNIDIKLVLIIVSIIFLLALLTVLAIGYIKDNRSNKNNNPPSVDPIVEPENKQESDNKKDENPEEKPEETKETEKQIYSDSKITVTQSLIDSRYYYLIGYDVDKINHPAFKVGSQNNTIKVYYNDLLISDVSKTWSLGTRVYFDRFLHVNDTIHIVMSTNSNTSFVINGSEFSIDSSLNEFYIIFK